MNKYRKMHKNILLEYSAPSTAYYSLCFCLYLRYILIDYEKICFSDADIIVQYFKFAHL